MWLLCAFCVGLAVGSFIQLGDKSFRGEDSRIQQELKERTSTAMPPPAPTDHCPDAFLLSLDPELEQEETDGRRVYQIVNRPVEHQMKLRIVDLMQHHIYATQYRMKDLQAIIDKYANDINYRVGYVYSRLETLLYDMMVLMTRSRKTIRDHHRSQRTFYYHLFYYTYMCKKNVDITYIVEYMIQTHTKHMASIATPTKRTRNSATDVSGTGREDMPSEEDKEKDSAGVTQERVTWSRTPRN